MVNEEKQPFYIGVVENRNDPLQAGRVQVRVFQIHSADKADIPTEDLPWATVSMFNIESGVGTSEVPVEGTRVLVAFLDRYFQEPVVTGVLPGIASGYADPSKGFNDPTGTYPKYLESDLNRLARGDTSDALTARTETLVTTSLFSEPKTAYAPQYPLNRVIASESGHILEMDDTPGAERVNLQHRSGSFSEYHPDGSHVSKIVGDDYEIVMSDRNLYVKGALNVAISGDVTMITDGNVNHSIGGKYVVNAGGHIELNGSQIHLNTGDATVEEVGAAGGDSSTISYNRIFVQDTEPTDPVENDLWIDTSDNNRIKAYDGTNWLDVSDGRLSSAATATGRLFAVHRVIYQPNEPDYRDEGPFADGDIWVDTDDGDKRYIWNTLLVTWSYENVSGLGSAILQAGISRAVKDGFTAIFKSSSIPVGAGESDYWFRQDTNSVYQLRNGEWKNLDNTFLATKLDELLTGVTSYLGVHYSATEPAGSESRDGDYWIVPATDTVYLLDGTWQEQTDSSFATFAQMLTTDRSIRDGRIRITIDYAEPDTADEGDLWIDISTDPATNAQKNWVNVYSGTVWERISDPDLEDQLVRSINYKEVEDREITVYFDDTAPDENSSPVPKLGDIWYDTSPVDRVDDTGYSVGSDPFAPDSPSTLSVPSFIQHRYNGARWVSVDDYRLEDALARVNVETIQRIAQGEALAQQITTVETRVGDNETEVQEVLTSIDGLYGGIGMQIDSNGHITGTNLISSWDAELVFSSGTGNFRVGENVYVGTSLAASTWSGKVITWNSELKRMRVVSETGSRPTAGTHVIGDSDGADFIVSAITDPPAPNSSLFEVIAENIRFIDPSDPLIPITPFSISGGVVYVGNVNTDNFMITYIGDYASAPSITGLDQGSVYKNTTDGNSYILDGSPLGWVLYLAKGTDGVDGADGADGSAGVDARTVNLTADDMSFEYDTAGNNPSPASATVTATASNTTGTVYYEFFKNDVSVQNTTVNTYSYTPQASFTNMPDKIEVQIREGSSSGTILARDQITMIGLREGGDGTTILLSNEAHTLPTTTAGTVTYTGSGTDINVWIGTVQIPYDGSSPYASPSFRVSATPSNITAGAASTVSTYTRRYADASAMTADNASITFTITVKDSAGTEQTYTKVQSLAKSRQGDTGATGATGATGTRGSVTLYASGTAWSDTTANNAITTATGSSTKIIGDIVTISDSGTGFSQTRAWDGSSWITVAQVIDGNLVVDGTIIGDKVAANTIKASNLILGDTQNLITEPTFTDTDFWSIQTGATVSTSSEITTYLYAPSGIAFTGTGRTANEQVNIYAQSGNYINVEPNATYRFITKTRHTAGVTGLLSIIADWYTQSGSSISSVSVKLDTSYLSSASGSAGTVTLEDVAVAPSDAYFLRFRSKVVWSGTLTNAGTYYIAAPRIERAMQGNLIVDGGITASKLTIGAWSDNLILNGSAVDDTNGWYLVEGTENTFLASTANPYAGGGHFRISGSSNAAYGPTVIPVEPGKTYVFRLAMDGSSAVSTGIYHRIMHAASRPTLGYLTALTRDGFTDLLSNGPCPATWTLYEYTWTCPTGMYWAQPSIYKWTGAAAITVDFTIMSFKEQSNGILIQDGAITADKMTVSNLAAISADLGAITAGSLNINGKFIVDSSGNVTIKNGTGADRVEITNSLITVYKSNIARVKIGSF